MAFESSVEVVGYKIGGEKGKTESILICYEVKSKSMSGEEGQICKQVSAHILLYIC